MLSTSQSFITVGLMDHTVLSYSRPMIDRIVTSDCGRWPTAAPGTQLAGPPASL